MPLQDSNGSGMSTPDHEVLDLGKAEVLQRRISAVDAEQVRVNQQFANSPVPPPVAPAAPPPPADPALTIPTPPVSDNYPPRVNDRIAKLYGQRMEAEERSAKLETQLAEQNRMLQAMMAQQQQRPAPWSNQYGQSEPIQSSGFIPGQMTPPPAGPQSISREEVQALLNAERQAHVEAMRLQQAHTASRDEAARDFPEVFSDPGLRSGAERIWASDPYLQKDPQGPYKAAALARGLSVNEQRAAVAQAVAADVRKTALTAMGPSVPDGTGQGPSQQQRYEQALARAKYTQEMSDFVLARKIQLGLA